MRAAIEALDNAENVLRICYGANHTVADYQLRRRRDLYGRLLEIGEEVNVSELLPRE